MPKLSAGKWMICTVVVASIAYFASPKLASQTVSSAAPTPFIAYQIERSFSDADHDQSNPVIRSSVFARRSDGSELHSFTTPAPDGTQIETREVTDVRNGRYLVLNTSAKTVTTFYHAPADLYKTVQRNQGCPAEANSPSAQRTTLLGNPVVVLRNVFPDVTEDLTEDLKVAVELGCYPLYILQTFASGAVNEKQVTSLVAAEPPDAFFDLPAEYREVSPSQANAEFAQKYGQSLWTNKFLKVLDKRYYAHR